MRPNGMKSLLRMVVRERFYRKITAYRSGMTTVYPVELNLLPSDRCLLLAPHADDESIACGGTIRRYPGNFEILCLTNGWSILSDMGREETIAVREREFTRAMDCAAVASYRYIREIDSDALIDHYADVRAILDGMDVGSFHYIFIPSLFDQHPDHKAVGRHLARYAAERNLPSTCRIVLYELWSTLPAPDRYVDISAWTAEKRELINHYSSQLQLIDYPARILALNAYRGMIPHVDSAEAYEMISMKKLRGME